MQAAACIYLSLCCLNRHPRKKDQAEITCAEIHQVEGAVGKILLRQLFDPDQDGKRQAADEDDPVPGLGGDRAKERQVDQQDQDPIQYKMSELVRIGDMINKTD